MADKPEAQPCGDCFKTGAMVCEEVFTEDMPAFSRYAELSRQFRFPALCQKDACTYHVCHIHSAAWRKTEKS